MQQVNNVVVLNRSDFTSKVIRILEEPSRFKRMNIEDGKAYNHLIHRRMKDLIKKNIFSRKKDLYPSGFKPEVLYYLAKIHKPLQDGTLSFHQILSAIGTPT